MCFILHSVKDFEHEAVKTTNLKKEIEKNKDILKIALMQNEHLLFDEIRKVASFSFLYK